MWVESPFNVPFVFSAPLIECPHKCHYDTPTLLSILHGYGFQANGMKGSDVPCHVFLSTVRKQAYSRRLVGSPNKLTAACSGHLAMANDTKADPVRDDFLLQARRLLGVNGIGLALPR
jgi:hypothetical protein